MSTEDFDSFKSYPGFKGVLAHDQLTLSLKENDFGVINLDDSTGPGTHWVGFYMHKNNPLYFDSFGLPPDDRIIKFLKGKNQILYNSSQLQDLESNRCGWYVTRWLNSMLGGATFYDSLYDDFTQKPSTKNETVVKT